MKELVFTILIFLCTVLSGIGQTVHIPDTNFLKALIAEGVDISGDGMIQETEAAVIADLTVDTSNIFSLEGIQAFANLKTLICQANKLTSLDVTGNPLLEKLSCNNNDISGLDVTSNPLLEKLDCGVNDITSLDVTANPLLKVLYCNANELTSLEVSSNPLLDTLSCAWNDLMSLDVTGNPLLEMLSCKFNDLLSLDVTSNPLLEQLTFANNDITSLNVTGNPLLKNLDCTSNDLTSLDITGNPLLENLECGLNKFTSLDISSNPLLEILYCFSNDLSSLDVSGNPLLVNIICYYNEIEILDVTGNPLLENLVCNENKLTMLEITGNPLLENLRCEHNSLATLDLTGNPLLENLRCEHNSLVTLDLARIPLLEILNCGSNNLTSLDLTSNPLLTGLSCGRNELASLDVSSNPLLTGLSCGGNNLASLNLSNNSQLNALTLSSSDSIQLICANLENLQLVLDRLSFAGLRQTFVSLYCDYDHLVEYRPTVRLSNDTMCNAISYIDQIPVTIAFNGEINSFFYTGNGSIYLPLAGELITMRSSTVDPMLYTIIDSVYTLDSTTLAQGMDSMGVFHDTLCAIAHVSAFDLVSTLLPLDVPRPGFDVTYKIQYENRGTIPVNATLGLKYDDTLVTFVDAEMMPDAHLGDSLTWSYMDLQPFEKRTFTLVFRLNSPMDTPPLNSGDEIEYAICMKPIVDDHHPDDNCYVLHQTAVNSLDPNDKQCLQGEYLALDMVGSWLTYMIRFENTGSAEAVTVRIIDEIDLDVFDINSFTPVDASHPYHIEIYDENQLHFVFPEIFLPFDDANNDGYVSFRIRTLDHLIHEDKIANQASIFFDFNFPIETNTAVTEVRELQVSTLEIARHLIKIQCSPNPASDEISIISPHPIEEVNLINNKGQIAQRIILLAPNSKLKISLKDLAAGVYLLEARTTQGIAVEKLVII